MINLRGYDKSENKLKLPDLKARVILNRVESTSLFDTASNLNESEPTVYNSNNFYTSTVC